MYCPDVVSLKQFYASETGTAARRMLWHALRDIWPEQAGDALLALGYPVPYLPAQAEEKNLIVVAMPAAQGALYWPAHQPNRVMLVNEEQLPFVDNGFNRVLVIHMLEHSENVVPLMRELWRVLTPGGRVLAVVPNRHGLWSHGSVNPFGHGRPYSASQMKDVLAQGELTYLRHRTALFMPPSKARLVHRLALMFEIFGRVACPMLGGVLLVEAEKQIYASLREPVRAWVRARAPAPVPIAAQPAFTPQ